MPKVKSFATDNESQTVKLNVKGVEITIPVNLKIGDVIESKGIRSFYYNGKQWFVNSKGLIHSCYE